MKIELRTAVTDAFNGAGLQKAQRKVKDYYNNPGLYDSVVSNAANKPGEPSILAIKIAKLAGLIK